MFDKLFWVLFAIEQKKRRKKFIVKDKEGRKAAMKKALKFFIFPHVPNEYELYASRSLFLCFCAHNNKKKFFSAIPLALLYYYDKK